MKILFCNIGWMEFYEGQSAKDQIQGGGSYVREQGTGYEVCNFAVYRGTVYGYVQPPSAKSQYHAGQIKIERIGENQSNYITDVLVIWTATRPEGGTVVVGWYKDASVYRLFQRFHKPPALHKTNKVKGYRIKAKKKHAVLLSIDQRTLKIPRGIKGGMGQSNIWYADSRLGTNTVLAVRKLVAGKSVRPKGPRSRTTDPEHNAKVEKAAEKKTWNYYERNGYFVKSVAIDNVGWDLEATLGRVRLQIEVKGLSGRSPIGELTPNEFKAFSGRSRNYRLAIVTNSLQKPQLLICRYSSERKDWVVDGHPRVEVLIKERLGATIKFRG